MLQTKIKAFLYTVLADLGVAEKLDFRIDIPPHKEMGDYASNIAILYARRLSRPPIDLAKEIAQKVNAEIFEKIEIAKPGFINFFLKDSIIQQSMPQILSSDHNWGKSSSKANDKVLLEFVSANPTGPLHVGHGRWAVIGDVIARLLAATGSKVVCEYYVNNIGNQIDKLLESVKAVRLGQAVPDGGYGGAYIKELRGETKEEIVSSLLAQQKVTLKSLGVLFDEFYLESTLHKKDKITLAVEKLVENKRTFEEGGAIWFKSEEFGDDKNRVLIRKDGAPTYFAADIAYHLDKFSRGYDHLIDIWGTDHHGYVKRLKAAIAAFGKPVEKLEIIIGQLVTLYRDKEPVRMSKRTGEMVTLQEVVDEIGADATRFFFAATDVNSHLDFDLELAKKKSHENPVYYVQYAHARICSILRKSGVRSSEFGVDLSGLTYPAERELMLKLISWPDVVAAAARLRHPHRICEYGKELASVFHSFYEKCKVLGNPGRLVLVDCSRIVLRNVLELLGISAPEKM